MTQHTDRLFRTTSFYLSAFLIARGLELIDCDREDGGRTTFLFKDSDELICRVNEFTLGRDAPVQAPAFVSSIKRLKSLLYDGI